MYFLYSLTLTLVFFALLPYFAYQVLISKKYLRNLSERLGNLPAELSLDPRPAIWVHAVSVGEAIAAIPLLDALRPLYPQYRIIVSTTTETGQAVARSRLLSADGYCYFPFDWRRSTSRTMDALRPRLVVLMESELWPNFLSLCAERSVPVLVANGRISDRSFRRARSLRFLASVLYQQVSHFAMQGEADAKRARALGAPADRVSVCGNLKYDSKPAAQRMPDSPVEALVRFLSSSQAPLVIAGSTAEGEEQLVIAAFKKVQQVAGLEHARLLIAPRHPERFEKVAQLLDGSGLVYLRRSSISTPAAEGGMSHEAQTAVPAASTGNASFDAILLDSIGELTGLYRVASVVIIGGSLVPRGGHNILEPAINARPIVVGHYMSNFRDMTETFRKREAVIQLPDLPDETLVVELARTLQKILVDPEYASRLGRNARDAVEANRGATPRIMSIIERLLDPTETRT
ncbi:MAG: 3-deoxy-D-manno-octulosonic acid transferase [Acidobacteriota bacterium]